MAAPPALGALSQPTQIAPCFAHQTLGKGPDHNTAKKLFFGMLDDVVFGQCEINCFSGTMQLSVPKWAVVDILWWSECARPRALKILSIEFAMAPHKQRRLEEDGSTQLSQVIKTHIVLTKGE